MRQKIIIDTDIGDDIDDAYAISMLAKSGKFEILGITTVYKNVSERSKITKALVRSLGLNCPVVSGIERPEKEPLNLFPYESYDENGIIHLCQYLPETWNERYDGDDAVDFLLEMAKRHPHEITLIALGPFSNLGAAFRKDPDAFNLFRELVLMAGSFKKPYREWNTRCDPESLAEILNEKCSVPAYVTGIDITRPTLLGEERLKRIFSCKHLGFLKELTKAYMQSWGSEKPPTMHDPVACACLLGSRSEFRKAKLRVGLEGEERSLVIEGNTGKECSICIRCDYPGFLDEMTDILTEKNKEPKGSAASPCEHAKSGENKERRIIL